MVCEGAATSEACAIRPQDFFRRGAALAVQSYTKSGVYKTNAEVLFYGTRQAPAYPWGQLEQVEYDLGSPVEIEVGGYGHKKFRLVCDPLYHRNCYRYPRGYIKIQSDDAAGTNNCYDVWDVSRRFEQTHADGTQSGMRIPPGRYLMEVDGIDYSENRVDATLQLRLTRKVVAGRATKNLRARIMSTGPEVYTFDVPLTSCGPSNLVLLDLDRVKNRLWKPRQTRTPLPVPEPESAGEGFPAAKRQRVAISPAEEQYDVSWDVADQERSANSQQQGRENVPHAFIEAPTQSVLSHAPGRSPPEMQTENEASGSYGRGGSPELGSGIPTPSTASLHGVKRDSASAPRPLEEVYFRMPATRSAWGSSDSDSDSESSGSVHSIPNFATFPVGT